MGSNLSIGSQEGGYARIDEFFKSLMFQQIMDSKLTRNERDVLLVIFRKTLHFDKWMDNISMHWLSKSVGIGINTLRPTLKKLEEKKIIEIEVSTGGKSKSAKRFNGFRIGTKLRSVVYEKWEQIKEDNNIPIEYS